MEQSKKPYLSKTLWLNFIVAACALFYPKAAEWIAANPVAAASILSGLNVALRFVTKDKLELY